jgi:hypothetical protein
MSPKGVTRFWCGISTILSAACQLSFYRGPLLHMMAAFDGEADPGEPRGNSCPSAVSSAQKPIRLRVNILASGTADTFQLSVFAQRSLVACVLSTD